MQRTRTTRTLILSLTLLALLSFSIGNVIAKPESLVRADIPEQYTWDLGDIYPNWEAWEADLAVLQQTMDEYIALQGTLADGPETVLKAYQTDDKLGILLYKIYRYPQLMLDLDTRNNEIGARMQQIQIMLAKFGTATAWFSPELLSIPWETMEGWLNSNKALAPYRYSIENLYRQQEHVLDEDKEKLLSYFSNFSRMPGSAYTSLSTADIDFKTIQVAAGDSVLLTPGRYSYLLTHNRNQADRALASETMFSVYQDNINTYASIYDGILQRDWAMAQARNYGSCLEATLTGDNVPVDVYKSLVQTVREGTEPVHRYLRIRKETLGLESYHLYDGSVPLVDFDKTYEYDNIIDWIVESVKPLGKDYQKQLRAAFDDRWIDVYETEGKAQGAYSANVYGIHPFLLLNYAETLSDVFTVGHEMGHCMHSMLSAEGQPFVNANPTIFVAEVASTMNESLLLEYMLDRTEDPLERVALLQHAIESIIGTFYLQVMFADFEWKAHEMVEQGQPITSETLGDLYMSLLKTYYGDAVDYDTWYPATWARISHFYGSPFYVYKYATCFATSAKLHKEITSEDKKLREDAIKRYMGLLGAGSSDYPMQLLKDAGVDLSQPTTIQSVVEELDNLVTRFEVELKKI